MLEHPLCALGYFTLFFLAGIVVAFTQRNEAIYKRLHLFARGRYHAQWEAGVASIMFVVVVYSLFSFFRAYAYYGHRSARLPHGAVVKRAIVTVVVSTGVGVLAGLAVRAKAVVALASSGPAFVVVLVWLTSEWQQHNFKFLVPLRALTVQRSAHWQGRPAPAKSGRSGEQTELPQRSPREVARDAAVAAGAVAAGAAGAVPIGSRQTAARAEPAVTGIATEHRNPAFAHEVPPAAAHDGRRDDLRAAPDNTTGSGPTRRHQFGMVIAFALLQLLLAVPCIWLVRVMGSWGWCVAPVRSPHSKRLPVLHAPLPCLPHLRFYTLSAEASLFTFLALKQFANTLRWPYHTAVSFILLAAALSFITIGSSAPLTLRASLSIGVIYFVLMFLGAPLYHWWVGGCRWRLSTVALRPMLVSKGLLLALLLYWLLLDDHAIVRQSLALTLGLAWMYVAACVCVYSAVRWAGNGYRLSRLWKVALMLVLVVSVAGVTVVAVHGSSGFVDKANATSFATLLTVLSLAGIAVQQLSPGDGGILHFSHTLLPVYNLDMGTLRLTQLSEGLLAALAACGMCTAWGIAALLLGRSGLWGMGAISLSIAAVVIFVAHNLTVPRSRLWAAWMAVRDDPKLLQLLALRSLQEGAAAFSISNLASLHTAHPHDAIRAGTGRPKRAESIEQEVPIDKLDEDSPVPAAGRASKNSGRGPPKSARARAQPAPPGRIIARTGRALQTYRDFSVCIGMHTHAGMPVPAPWCCCPRFSTVSEQRLPVRDAARRPSWCARVGRCLGRCVRIAVGDEEDVAESKAVGDYCRPGNYCVSFAPHRCA